MSIKESEEFILNLFEAMFRAQLNALRKTRKGLGLTPENEPAAQRTSRMGMVYDVLVRAHHPMHVNDIITEIDNLFSVRPDKDSLVSALSKCIRRQDRFTKTAPNTFTLISGDVAEGRQS